MSAESLRIAAIQYAIHETPEENLYTIAANLEKVAPQRPDLVVLPEVCLTGFGMGAKAPAFTEEDPRLLQLLDLARKHRLRILAGIRAQLDGQRANRALLFDESGIQLHYDKQVLFSYWNEQKLFRAGRESKQFMIGDWRVAPFICYELRFPELFRRCIGAELMLVIANWPSERRHHWLTLLRARAIENQCYVLGCNRIGTAGQVSFAGDTVVFDPYGATLKELGDEEGILVQDLDLSVLRDYRQRFPALDDVKYLV